MNHEISSAHLSVDRVEEILNRHYTLSLSDDARARIVRCREYLDRKMETRKEPIYGITTGFGSLCNISVEPDQLAQLQKNLVMSHACGTGERVPAEIVRLMLLSRSSRSPTAIRACSWLPSSDSSTSSTTTYSRSSTSRGRSVPRATWRRWPT